MSDWTRTMPVYVTRKSASGETGTLSLSIWMALLAILLVWLNLIGWAIVGLVEIVRYFA